MTYRVAVLGATGLVGQTLLRLLAERAFPVREVVALASERSVGRPVRFGDETLRVQLAEPAAFAHVDLVLASAGASVSRELLPAAVAQGAVAIDNTSAYRMDPEVPLVVPEVNAERISGYVERGIIANPNCSTIQLVVALKPLHDRFTVRRVIVSTYQSVSGAGQRAVDEVVADLGRVTDTDRSPSAARQQALAFNALPKIDVFVEDGETREEWKMRVETCKIIESRIPVHATCVRVPIVSTHSEAVWIETDRPASPDQVREVLRGAAGVVLVDDPATGSFPTTTLAAGEDPVYVGRIRRDPTVDNGVALWIVADNIRKGAALNAVQIAEGLVELWRRDGRRRPDPATSAAI